MVYSLGYNILGPVSNAKEAFKIINENSPDILLVDINIQGDLNGIELVKTIGHLNLPIIYTTGIEEKHLYDQARLTSPSAYLVKPYNKLTFQTAIEKAILSIQEKKSRSHLSTSPIATKSSFYIKSNNFLVKVKADDINYIKSDGNYCEIQASKKYVVKMSLSQLYKRLPIGLFIRTHQRFIIHRDKIERIDQKNNEVIINQTPIPFGPKFKDDLFRNVNKLL